MQLSVTDIECHHVGCATLQQAVGEPTGRRPGVQDPEPGDVDPERFERGVELLAAATDEARRGTLDHHGIGRVDQASRLVGDCSVDQDQPRFDRPRRLGPARHQPTADQVGVKPLTPRHRLPLRGSLLGRSLLAAWPALFGRQPSSACAFLAGAFLAALAFLAGGFLAAEALAWPLVRAHAHGAGHGLDPRFDVVEALSEPAELLGDFALDQADQLLGRRPPSVDQALDRLLGILAAQLAGLDEIADDLLGVVLRHLAELHSGVE